MKSTLATLAAATVVNAGHHGAAGHHGCFEHVDYPGRDIMKTENIHSAETCQAICRETEGCSTFTWSPSEGFCWSKYVAANRIEHDGRVSGPAFCGGEIIVEPTPESVVNDFPCVEAGIDYFGNDVKSIDNVHSAEQCKALCQETEGCLYFTWSPSDGFCWAKFSAEGRRENSNRISGRVSCGECVFCSQAIPECDPGCENCARTQQTCQSCPVAMCLDEEETMLPTAQPTYEPTMLPTEGFNPFVGVAPTPTNLCSLYVEDECTAHGCEWIAGACVTGRRRSQLERLVAATDLQ